MEALAFDLDDAASRARYDRLISACPRAFIQQSTSWAELIADIGPDRPILLLATHQGEAVGGLPLYLFDAAPGPIMTSVPQAGPLGGVFCRPGVAPEPVYAALLAEADARAREHGCLTLTLITSPLVDDLDYYCRYLSPSVTLENFTQVVPLDAAVRDGRFCLADNRHRNPGDTIRKAEAAGLVSRVARDDREFDAWYTVHRRRHDELGLQPLSEVLLGRIWRELGQNDHAFLQLVLASDEIAAGGLFIYHREVCDAYVISMNSKFAKAAPNYLLIKAAMLEMTKRAIRLFNWQSSARRNDGVYKFKKQWGSQERQYYFATKTYCDDAVILGLGKDGARRHYPGHFLVPFGVFDIETVSGAFSK